MGAPVLQVVVPTRQVSGLPVQAEPAAHEMQALVEVQTRLVPHDAPTPFAVPSTQTGTPEPHEMVPLKHGFGLVVQLAPWVHMPHVPVELHTRFDPQLVPAGLFAPSVQTGAPDAHATTPNLQAPGFVAQLVPALHAMHAPLPLQTCPTPHDVPAAAFIPFTQVVVPELQSVLPAIHGAPGLVLHALPATHAPQLPPESHTWPEPQVVPAGLLLPSTQTPAPEVQLVTPLRQAAPGFVVQARFAVQLTQLPFTEHT